MKHRDFMSLTKDEVKQVVSDMFQSEKVTNIKYHQRNKEITCTIYTEWETMNDKGETETAKIADPITIRDPFLNRGNAIDAEFSLDPRDYTILKQFCYAKGICPWNENNPYLQAEEEKGE